MGARRRGWRIALAATLLVSAADAIEAVEISVQVRDQKGLPLADAIIVAVPSEGALKPAAVSAQQSIEQVDLEFVPKVKAVVVGTSVSFPNRDGVRHHVYSFSAAKRFALPLYAGTPAQPVLFDQPGLVVLGCNIHDWMIGYVYVSESPYFAQTGKDGRARLPDLPARHFVLRVWHPQMEGSEDATRKTVDLVAGRNAEMVWDLKTKPELRIRRAPSSNRRGSY